VKNTATLVIETFSKLTKQNRAALNEVEERLVRLIEADAEFFVVRFEKQS